MLNSHIAEELCKVKQDKGDAIVVFGSLTLSHLLRKANLLDEYLFFVNPILSVKGISMFQASEKQANLKLLENKLFASGVVCLHYAVEK